MAARVIWTVVMAARVIGRHGERPRSRLPEVYLVLKASNA